MGRVIHLPPEHQVASLHFEQPMGATEFLALSKENPELVMELEPNGIVNVMSPVTPNSGNAEGIIITYLGIWSIENGLGRHFSSSTGFTLPDGSVRSPDAAWVSDEQLAAIDLEELDHFAQLVPAFVVEVRSKTDRLPQLKDKMKHVWMANGVQLAWLIDLQNEQVIIYRADGSEELISSFVEEIGGENILQGFSFALIKLLK